MRVNRGVLGWGLFFIMVGLVPLAVRGGLVDAGTVRRAWELWPLILIGIGLGLVLQRTRAAFVGGVLVAVTFGLMGGSALAAGFGPVAGLGTCGFGGGFGTGEAFTARSGTLGSSARVTLDLSCGELTAASGPGSGWQVSGTSGDGTPPDIVASDGRLSVRSPDHHGFDLAGGSSWSLTLPRDPSIQMGLTVNAGTARIDLTGMAVTDIDTTVNAGDAHLNLSTAVGTRSVNASVNAGSLALSLPTPDGTLSGNLSANAGSISVCVPAGVALRIDASDSALGSDNFGSQGLTRNGNVWTNGVSDVGANRIELNTSANLGAVNLNPESGCD
jgi:hypothetical protein